jgi:hypothetical protein
MVLNLRNNKLAIVKKCRHADIARMVAGIFNT